MKTKTTTTSKPKARLMWASDPQNPLNFMVYGVDLSSPSEPHIPVAVIDLSDPDALVERVAKAIYSARNPGERFPGYGTSKLLFRATYCLEARAALRALGIPTSKQKQKKSK